ncbi:hypothetical protein FZW96_13750 [Bacillus sp. BGMRC 2118]|nr:hypothetical protein FZW96_13750 [Bacillus sp. BGMRC 2118]
MKVYQLKKTFSGYKKGTRFYLISESEFIGVKEYVFRTEDLTKRLAINESELQKHFSFVRDIH